MAGELKITYEFKLPIMEPLKPMVRYHLPFACLDETVCSG
jgi:hypothetical protein